jgi:adenylate cyclase
MAYLASLLAVSGEWERGCTLMRKVQSLNPRFSGWYWIPAIGKAYAEGHCRRALNLAVKINTPDLLISQFLLAAIYGQLGELEKAQRALQNLLTLRSKFASEARKEFAKRYQKDFLDRLIEGLRETGIEIADGAQSQIWSNQWKTGWLQADDRYRPLAPSPSILSLQSRRA